MLPGDTFWSIAQRYGCTVEAITNANTDVTPEELQIGQVIRVPGGESGSSFSNTHGPLRPTGNAPPNARLGTMLNGRVPSWCEPLRDMHQYGITKDECPQLM